MPGMEDAPILYRGLRAILPHVVDPWFSLDVEGMDNLPDGPAILACNHLSFIDSIVLPAHIKRPVYFLGKADYFESWKTKWFFSGVGVVPVHRQGGRKGRESLDTGIEILRRGDLLGIYPEGTRSPDGRLYRGKTGPARMALEADVPIVPCAVAGTDKAMPTGTYVPRKRHVRLKYGRPLDLSRYRDKMDDPFALRSATDELMFEIMMLSGQEYVDEYASKVKSGAVDTDLGAADEDNTSLDDEDMTALRDAADAA